MNLDDRDVEPKGNHLSGMAIDFVVTGGIAAIEAPKWVRELRRYGAQVRVFMTVAATKFINPIVFEWASKNSVTTDLSGAAEHITPADAIVIAPATLDFISKISHGIADSASATLVQSALGRIPLVIAPAMHSSLAENPIYKENLEQLRQRENVKILRSDFSESKAKILAHEEAVAEICHFISRDALKSQRVLISLGPTRSYADDMRFLSNRSTGALGLAIADELYRWGAEVQAVVGAVQVKVPSYLRPSFVETNDQMRSAFVNAVEGFKPTVGIFSAAVLDFEIENPSAGKVSSRDPWTLKLRTSSKLIQSQRWPDEMIKVGFKLESKISVDELKSRAKTWAKENRCQVLIANRLEDVSENHTAYLYVDRNSNFEEIHSKRGIAVSVTQALRRLL